ncbi:hypothetical protein MTR67_006741 [Solanum verrucosum]|uniref:Uncharacterized protein n=1 Tax=Solanum verrucosum TaxID=315347 RepID=A0AAF0TC40_SOLVR|nr:hypothetical protein MTR67_006741 [Solanum verrucosum]
MEGLNHMIRKANVNGWIKGFKAQNQGNRDNEVGITHLLYADDTLVFCEAEVIQIRHIRAILTIFEGISGLHVNWQKSFLYPVNQVDNMELLARNLGCQIATLPTRYLGMPLGAQNKETAVWSEILERCNKKLARWKSQYLSLGGRLTLVKSVLDALPSYMMSLFPIPKNIVKKIDQLRSTEGKLILEDGVSEVAKSLLAAYDSGELCGALAEGQPGWKNWVKKFGKLLKRKGKSLFMPLRVLLTGKLHGPDIGATTVLLYKAGTSGSVAPQAGFVTFDERFKILREIQWESFSSNVPLSAGAITH